MTARRRPARRTHAFRANVLRGVTGNLARFLAVFAIVAIGAGVYAGLRCFVPDMYASADALFDRYNLADVQVSSPAGLTASDLAAVRAVPGVRGAAGMQSFEASAACGGRALRLEVTARDMAAYEASLDAESGLDGDPAAVSRPILLEGRLPAAPGEMAVSTSGDSFGEQVRLGDVVEVTAVDGAGRVADVLADSSFTVVGVVQSPEWLCTSLSVSPTSGAALTNFAFIDLGAAAHPGVYTTIALTCEDAYARTAFTEGYDDAVAPTIEALKELGRAGSRDWYVVGRDASSSSYLYEATALRMGRICSIFPAFFFLVAALVSLTTTRRMVEADRVEVGTLKALGYAPRQIAGKYLAFSGLASVSGACAGVCAGVLMLPAAIWTAYSRMYIDFPFIEGFHEPYCAAAALASVGLCLGMTLAAVRGTLREPASALLAPAVPKAGRRIALERVRPLWRRMPFSLKVCARNALRYKGRMLMTVLGVAGCCGLLLTGFGVRDELDGFVQEQYGGIYTYDVMVNFDAAAPGEAGDAGGAAAALVGTAAEQAATAAAQADPDPALTAVLDDELGAGNWSYFCRAAALAENPGGDPSAIPYGVGGELDRTGGSVQAALRAGRADQAEADQADQAAQADQADADQADQAAGPGSGAGDAGDAGGDAGASGIVRDVGVVVPRDAGQGLIRIDDAATGGPLALPGSGAVLTERLAEQLMVGVGDAVLVSFDDGGAAREVRVAGVMRNFVGHFVYLSPAAYEEAFGAAPAYNLALGSAPDGLAIDIDALRGRLATADPRVRSVTVPQDESGRYEDITSSLGSIVGIIVAVSCALAFIVVYALTEVNIEERRREIATLKVLGFTRREVRGYVFRETYLHAGAGILLGLPFGAWLCDWVMRAAEFDNVIYFRTVGAPCYLWAALLTAAAVCLVTLAMRRRLAGIDMADSLSSVD